MTAGYYNFDAEGKMVIKNGVINGYMYINGQKVERYALVKYDGNYYFVNDGRKVAVNKTLYLSDAFVAAFCNNQNIRFPLLTVNFLCSQ